MKLWKCGLRGKIIEVKKKLKEMLYPYSSNTRADIVTGNTSANYVN